MKIIIFFSGFPAHDELGTCRTSLASPEQRVLCSSVRPTHVTVYWGFDPAHLEFGLLNMLHPVFLQYKTAQDRSSPPLHLCCTV